MYSSGGANNNYFVVKFALFLFLTAEVNYDDTVILTAIQFENACNPVLRANAQATLERYINSVIIN